MATDGLALNAKAKAWAVDVHEVILSNLSQAQHSATPAFAVLAEHALRGAHQKNLQSGESLPWLALPLCVAESLRSPAEAALRIGAGIELARISAGILDQCLDHDTDDAVWTQAGMSQAINLATALTALALLTVGQIQQHGVSCERAAVIHSEFERTWFRMCEAQYQELSVAENDDVAESVYWDIASAKSGRFFELACKAPVLLSNERRSDICDRYAAFGHNIGLMMQLMNDLEGLWEIGGKKDIGQRLTLPILFARSRLEGTQRDEFNRLLHASPTDVIAAKAVQEITESVGAIEFTLWQFQIYREEAIHSLDGCANTAILLGVLDGLFAPLSSFSDASSS